MTYKINELTSLLCNEINKVVDVNKKVEIINAVRKKIHEVSPLKHHPVDFVEWIKKENVYPNDYNPNSVPTPEMKLLETSIDYDGFTMPIPNDNTEDIHRVIVDGFHRFTIGKTVKKVYDSTFGYLPLSNIREENRGKEKRIASTIRHNRARGSHSVELMSNIVSELVKAGMSDAWILKNIAMDADELLRLKQVSGLAELFKNNQFSNSIDNG